MLAKYPASLESDRRALLERFELVDLASKVVGVGSVGTRCFVALFMSDIGDPLFLQVKEARPLGWWRRTCPGDRRRAGRRGRRARRPCRRRRVRGAGGWWPGQRLMQAASDIFLGWADTGETDFYVRQFRDMKGTVDAASLGARGLRGLRQVVRVGAGPGPCPLRGRGARSPGTPATGECSTTPSPASPSAYADQTEHDHALLVEAVRSGRIVATPGL